MYDHCHHAALTMYTLLGDEKNGYKLQKLLIQMVLHTIGLSIGIMKLLIQ